MAKKTTPLSQADTQNLNIAVQAHQSGDTDTAEKVYRQILTKDPTHAGVNNFLGILMGQKGDFKKAAKLIHTSIKTSPKNPATHKNLGNAYRELGQLKKSVTSYQNAILLKPDYIEAHHELGTVYFGLGKTDDAIDCYQQTLTLNPNHAHAYFNLGLAYNTLDLFEKAYQHYQQSLALEPNNDQAQINLGEVCYELRLYTEATTHFEQALVLNPNQPEAFYNLGMTYTALNQLNLAKEHYQKAISLDSHYTEAHNNLGMTYYTLGEFEAAIKYYKQALTINPNHARAHNNLGVVLNDIGHQGAAIKHYEQALVIKPDYASAHRHLSTVKQYTTDDLQINQMQLLLSTENLSQSDQTHLSFALAKAYEDLGQHAELFKVLHEGNRLRKKSLSYSLDQDKNLHSTIRKIFSSFHSINEQSAPYKPSPIQPIFIVGMPRSGTTLVEQILASHHFVHGAGELYSLSNIVTPTIEGDLTHNPSKLSKETCQSIRQQYLDSLAKLNVSEKVITDKMPLNFQYIGFILSAFPDAKIIHLKRDSRATCWSIYKHYFDSKGNGFSYNQNDLAAFYHMYTNLMAFWHQVFPDKIYDLCYEDLTTNQEKETKNLLNYCELEWDKNCLNFHANKRAVKTVSALQVRQKMYQGSSESWRKYEEHLQPLINALKPIK